MHFEASLGQLACYMFREFVTNLVFDGLTLGCAGTNWAISWPCLSPNQAVSGQIWPFLAIFIPKSTCVSTNLAIFGFNYPQHWVVLGRTVNREGRFYEKHENEMQIFVGILKCGREPKTQISKFMTKVGRSELLVLNF